jgi:APA family basic amino acid/polyamine antiporter
MATYRQLPEALRRLHPRFKTPWLSLVLFAGVGPILLILPGDVNFIGTLYSLGATLSFTIAHSSLVRMRMRDGSDAEIPYKARPNLRIGAVSWPVFAILGGIATGISFLVLVVQNPLTRWVGLGWMVAGLVGYAIYRRRFLHVPLRAIEKAPPALGPALALEYRNLLVPVVAGQPSDAAMDVACSSQPSSVRASSRSRCSRSARPSSDGSLPGARGGANASSTRRARSVTRTVSAS